LSDYLATEKSKSYSAQSLIVKTPVSAVSWASGANPNDLDPAVSTAEVIVNVTQDINSTDGETNEENKRVHLRKGDPLPASVESKILSSESLLRQVTDKL
jgi:hypothetical protein